jgi:hypothetical protein
MKTITDERLRLPVIALVLAFCVGNSFASWAQPCRWTYSGYENDRQGPIAKLIDPATDTMVVLRPGDRLEGYPVLTVAPERVVLDAGSESVSLEYAKPKNAEGLSHRIPVLRETQMPIRELMKKLAEYSRLDLVVDDTLEGTLSVDFSNMTVKEILDIVCRFRRLH